MITREYQHQNVLYNCVEFQCERTSVILQVLTPKIVSIGQLYIVKYGDSIDEYQINSSVFLIIKSLFT